MNDTSWAMDKGLELVSGNQAGREKRELPEKNPRQNPGDAKQLNSIPRSPQQPGPGRENVASIRQLAKALGVSAATVSLALRQSPRISARMRARVQAAAAAAGYQPDPAAARLMAGFRRQQRRGVRGVIAAVFPPGMSLPSDPHDHSALAIGGMRERARELGYQLDHFELGANGLTGDRLAGILKARGIEGVVIMHAVPSIARLPMPLDDFSVVAIGLSVRQKLPRVCLHQYQDMQTLCLELRARGYRRPGLLMNHDLNERTNFQFSAAYLAVSQFHFGHLRIPIFFTDERPMTELRTWLKQKKPDVVIYDQGDLSQTALETEARAARSSLPDKLGLASLDIRLGRPPVSGLLQGWSSLGKRAAEAVISRVYHGLKGPEAQPSVEMVTGEWRDGPTAPGRRTSRNRPG